MIQTVLAIVLLINAPVRIQDLASIDLGRNLLEVGRPRQPNRSSAFPRRRGDERERSRIPVDAGIG
jgi:hypothetical protein